MTVLNVQLISFFLAFFLFISNHATRNPEYKDKIYASPENVPQEEISALYSLYNATNGANWKWLNESHGVPWLFGATANPCADNWQGIGCSLVPPLHIESITLEDQYLQGTLPVEIGDLPELQILAISHSKDLSGPIPVSMGNLTQLQSVDLSRNALTQTLPTILSTLHNLQSFLFFGNQLTGTIPMYLCTMTELLFLDISFNRMYGTVPNCIGDLKNLSRGLGLSNNHLSGTIPASIDNFTQLHGIDFDTNDLTGTIPATVGLLSRLRYLLLFGNMLSGSIPHTVGNLGNLLGIYVYNNHLTGTLPSTLALLPSFFRALDVSNNFMSGSIPSYLSNFPQLVFLRLNNNHFTGTIPQNLATLADLAYFQIFQNYYTGTLPTGLGIMAGMLFFQVYDNYLTGPLPQDLSNMTRLQSFQVDHNLFSGPLSPELGALLNLIYLWVGNNNLDGAFPNLANLTALQELSAESNHLSGTIEDLFNPAEQIQLQLVELSNNQLTGTIPADLYALPALTTFAAVSNCFKTTLTEQICGCTTLLTLALDGLQSASQCQQKILPGISKSYQLANQLKGGIPICLFAMPRLNTLHLSGNGITGSFPVNLTLSSSLFDLSLSHNFLTGTIPSQVQEREWYNLDLSYNRLGGDLHHNFAQQKRIFPQSNETSNTVDTENSAVYLENNRLSGDIPNMLRNAPVISILGSNLFSCDLSGRDLPKHDSDRDTYSCGSDNFNIPYYIWLGLVIVLMIGCALSFKHGALPNRTIALAKHAVQCVVVVDTAPFSAATERVPSLAKVAHLLGAACRLTVGASAYVLVVLLPLYGVCSSLYGSYTYQYAWTLSADFASGIAPTALEMAALLVLVAAFLVCAFRFHFRSGGSAESGRTESNESTAMLSSGWKSAAQLFLSYAMFICISFAVVLGVNIAYVYFVLYGDSRVLLLVQIVLSLFKLFWNSFSMYLMRWMARTAERITETKTLAARSHEVMFVLLMVALVNNIGIPCLVVSIISPNCFYNIFVAAPHVSARYTYSYCAVVNNFSGECGLTLLTSGSTKYAPPFTYSYQCSSSFITYYSPAFVFLCITATFITPAVEMVALWLSRKLHAFPLLSRWFLPKLLRRLEVAAAPRRDHFNPYLDVSMTIVNILTYLGLLMTFGAVFPPLAVALAVTILVTVWWEKVKLGRFLTQVHEQGAHAYANILEAECRGVEGREVLHMAVWTIATASCLFYTLFLFDTLGDAVGFGGAYWVLIVMPLLPGVTYAAYCGWSVWMARHERPIAGDQMGEVVGAIALSPMGQLAGAGLGVTAEAPPPRTESSMDNYL